MVKKSNMDVPNKSLLSPSPAAIMYEKYARHRQPREDIEQFVRFIRDFPPPRQATELAFMKKKNPLPEIGHGKTAVSQCGDNCGEHTSQLPRQCRFHSVGADEEQLDSENRLINTSNSLSAAESEKLFQKVLHQRHPTSDVIPLDRTSSSLDNTRLLMASSLSAHPTIELDCALIQSAKQKVVRTRSDPTRRRVTANVRNLPPITVNRQAFIECPTRPSAPSPSCTPPLPSSDDEVFLEEEPSDFIDTR